MECRVPGPQQWVGASSEDIRKTQGVQGSRPRVEFPNQVPSHGGKLPLFLRREARALIDKFADVEHDQKRLHSLPLSIPNGSTSCNLLELMYPKPTMHNYRIEDVCQWSRRMLSPEEFKKLKRAAFRLEPDSLPRTELTGLYFNKHRPCWSVDYYTRQRRRKTIDFFVPDVSKETVALVLKYAVACRIVLPRRFEDVPLFIPEPDGETGGQCYRGGARSLEPHVLEWILNDTSGATVDANSVVAMFRTDIGKQQICSGGSTDFTYPPTSPDVTTTTDQSPVPVSPSLSSLNYGDSSLPCSPAPVSPVTVTSSTRDACGAAATATQRKLYKRRLGQKQGSTGRRVRSRKALGQQPAVETAQLPLDAEDSAGGGWSECCSIKAVQTAVAPLSQPPSQGDAILSNPLDVLAGWYAATDVDSKQMTCPPVQDSLLLSADETDHGLEIVSLPFSVTGVQIAAATAMKNTMG